MFRIITVSDVRKQVRLTVPSPGKRCFIIIDDIMKIQMVSEKTKGAANGNIWYFVCPETKKKCRKLVMVSGRYVHMSTIRNYYRKNKPEWYSESPINKILLIKQKQLNAERLLQNKWFRKTYKGKPTKRYQKCLNDIEAGSKYSTFGIINGFYEA